MFWIKARTLAIVPEILTPVYEPGPLPTNISSISLVSKLFLFKNCSNASTNVAICITEMWGENTPDNGYITFKKPFKKKLECHCS